jgi:hypothetical protein
VDGEFRAAQRVIGNLELRLARGTGVDLSLLDRVPQRLVDDAQMGLRRK